MDSRTLRNALSSPCGLASDTSDEVTTQITCAVTYDLVVPSEWTINDLVKGDQECEMSFEGTGITDINALFAATHVRA